jgi:hypothetical protein
VNKASQPHIFVARNQIWTKMHIFMVATTIKDVNLLGGLSTTKLIGCMLDAGMIGQQL